MRIMSTSSCASIVLNNRKPEGSRLEGQRIELYEARCQQAIIVNMSEHWMGAQEAKSICPASLT